MASGRPNDRDRDPSRDPFFWLFVILAVVLSVVLITNLRDDETTASFVSIDDQGSPSALATAEPLPTPQPTPVPEVAAAVVELSYQGDAISMSGTAPAQAVVEALVGAAGALVGPDAVSSSVEVIDAASGSAAVLVLSGQVDDDTERAAVVAAFGDLGLNIEDGLVLAGSDQTLGDVVRNDPGLSQFRDFLAAAGLLAELDQPVESGVTMFAPTNEAITGLDSAALDELGDAAELTEVLRHHFADGRFALSDLAEVTALGSQQGESLTVAVVDGQTIVGGATVSGPDIDAVNGIVHVVDSVLLPGTLRTEVALNELVTLDPVLFSSGSSTILDDSLATLDRAVQVLLDNPLGRVEVQGHTDSDGPAEVNLELSQLRADAVRNYLIEQGVEAIRVTAVGFGETELSVDPEADDDDKFANRRIEFRVS